MNSDKSNIYLLGFMGCGKTKIGGLLARSLARPFIDTDAVIIEETGSSINDLFKSEGEKGFREIEKDVISRISKTRASVVSLGGGSVLLPENWNAVSGSGITVALSYPPEILAARLERKKDRPLLNDLNGTERVEYIRGMLSVRDPYYRRADLLLHLNHEIAPQALAEMLLHYLRERL
jgi:shikimate kinase